jgi:hypothetical protein
MKREAFLISSVITKPGEIVRISAIFLFLIFLFSGADANPKLASKKQIQMFRNTKTCVVLEDGIHYYNAYIQNAVTKYWKITEYEFIDQTEFEKRRSDSKYSFLVLMDWVYDKDPAGISYNFISLVLGGSPGTLVQMPELCSIPLSYSDDKNADFEYVIPAVIQFMQKHIRKLETNRLMISIRGLKFYNEKSEFRDKVLLLNKDGMALYVDTPDRIKVVYPYYIKLLSPVEIKNEIASSPANALLHFHVGPGPNSGAGKCYEMIFDVEGNLYYYNFRKITNENGDGFNLEDFRNIR